VQVLLWIQIVAQPSFQSGVGGNMRFFQKFIKFLNHVFLSVCKYLTIGIMASLTVVVLVGAFFRYVLNDSLVWTEEISSYLLLYLAFIGSPIALKQGLHASVDAWIHRLPRRTGLPLFSFLHVMIMSFCLILMKFGVVFALNAKIQIAPYTRICMMYIFMVMPLGAFFLFMVSLEQIMDIFMADKHLQQRVETEL
jgi:TRAP-type C4-dicarboxylate transport system permease small subunit